ncbi:Pex19 protein [Eremomyces bilateralis CBS 781.70]|uniref:Pex19 protein n=1 Tax=Eremomyces bilateralis CBS 781.70 TaxID=1392243 RepID=A0A6G1FWC2_9PEZI|nr:Pex19 protein [Eremomyces bilateralis CBS 781.70]KAF1810195.1 Pex19 protein [Eremomyces bilateralis CBS 781.70]
MFSATTLEPKDKHPDASGADKSIPAPSSDIPPPIPAAPDFEKELQAGMAALLGELDSNPEMQKEMEALMKELGSATDLGLTEPSNPPPAASAEGSKATEDSFQENIRRTMERMQASGEQAGAAAAESSQQNFMMEMLKNLDADGEGGFDPANMNDAAYTKMISGLMEELTTKEILYEPMKELYDKYPEWIEKNKETVGKEDLARYREQLEHVTEIVGRFESPSYSDTNAADKAFISEKMEKMQNAGSPPGDLVNMSAAQEVLGDMDSGCPTQ